ncbi:hypothetical protein FV232_17690 [Methylobacterium sp. WL30]|uniref:hypothetical protein n=1 Tax=unclassified Methylobacterium TaxID=2615210 RepID=UPI0011C8E870|nr:MULTISPECIES: hypothetical protein [unclassified Methylobacterium]MCJ2076410.1 hypothetical protein [Methylobacterium sp. E-016]TXN33589.1 hypothetical protein FV225_18645 [Methylobacterium sp. WL93]TXN48865.1 hypothetical protein FV227_19180 [Methylobacterium sp. WL119]TXN65679.1 hypothetical protein FV232_17690 [Methylobacterium sp. WL30]
MSDRLSRWLLLVVLAATPAAAEPAVTILDLPFQATAMRGPRSEVAVAVATSGLIPLARPTAAPAAPDVGEEESAPLVVVWGKEGGAALSLVDGAIRSTLLGAEAIDGLTAAETPRGAVPGPRRTLSGAASAYPTGVTRAIGAAPSAAGLTIRERQPVAMGGDPKPVPVSTVTVAAGPDATFALARPRAVRLAGRQAFVVATLHGGDASGLALVTRAGIGDWAVTARTPFQDGAPLRIAAVADFAGTGSPQVAAVLAKGGRLQLWTPAVDAFTPAGEAPGYASGPGDVDLAAAVEGEGSAQADLALPVADNSAIALVSLKGGIRERARIALPAPAAYGVAALGRGTKVRILVGLSDGRVAVVAPDGTKP